jgi:hypothetical protein
MHYFIYFILFTPILSLKYCIGVSVRLNIFLLNTEKASYTSKFAIILVLRYINYKKFNVNSKYKNITFTYILSIKLN